MNPFPKMVNEASQGVGSEEEQLMQLLQSNPELMQKYQEQLAHLQSQAQKGAQHPPMTSKEYMEKLDTIQKYFDSEGGLTIEPSKAFVLKFLQKRSNEKIFINIVTHQVIDHPEQKLLVDFENQPGLRIPMSMGRVRQDNDKNGTPCKVVDVVLNPAIVKTAQTSPDVLNFTAQIIGNYLLEKYKIVVNDEMIKKVKGVKYKGNKVEIQRVKGRKAPKIQQISQEQQQMKQKQQQREQQVLNQMGNGLKKQVMRPSFDIFAQTQNGEWTAYSIQVRNVKLLKIIVQLPHLIHSKGIHLQGSGQMLYLCVKNLYELCLRMPFEVQSFKCRFGKKERKLQIKVFKKTQEVVLDVAGEGKTQKQVKKVDVQLDNQLLFDLV